MESMQAYKSTQDSLEQLAPLLKVILVLLDFLVYSTADGTHCKELNLLNLIGSKI